MGKVGRPPRTDPVMKTYACLTQEADDCGAEIISLLRKTKNVRITTMSDAINISLIEYCRKLRTEYGDIVKRASSRPIG